MDSNEKVDATEKIQNTELVLAQMTKANIKSKIVRYLNPKNNSRLGLNIKVLVLLLGSNLFALAIIFLCINHEPSAPAAPLNNAVNNAKMIVLLMCLVFAKIILVLYAVNDFYNKGKKIKEVSNPLIK